MLIPSRRSPQAEGSPQGRRGNMHASELLKKPDKPIDAIVICPLATGFSFLNTIKPKTKASMQFFHSSTHPKLKTNIKHALCPT
jgi:hypothetical protein